MTGALLQPAWRVFGDYFAAGGWLMLPLLGVAFSIWCGYLLLVLRLRRALAGPSAASLDLASRVARDPDGTRLRSRLSGLPGATPRLVRELLGRVRAGQPFREAFLQCREAELAPYSHAFYVLGALVVAAPLLGLLGTVLGMIETFDAVALGSGAATDMVARGISQALITTQVGLIAALPGTLGLAHCFRLYQRLRNACDQCESHLALVLEHPIRTHGRGAERTR